MWNAQHNGACSVEQVARGKRTATLRQLDTHDTFVRDLEAVAIVDKVIAHETNARFMSEMVSARKPFGLATNVKPIEGGDLHYRYSGGLGEYPSAKITNGGEWVAKWKVIISYLTYDHAGRPGKDGKKRILSTTEILPPNSVCSETYLVAGVFDTKEEAEHLSGYLKTKFARFLIAQQASTQHIKRDSFTWVPIQDFTKPWNDMELYIKYELNPEEVAYIESTIKEM